jgi:Orsellinic acid/F9775 biosynthesis cluster protein D
MEHFTHLPKFQVIVYKECQYAVLPSYIHAHFIDKRQHGLKKEERERIIDVVAEIDGLISNHETLKRCEFPFPPPTSKPIAVLAKPKRDGMRCMVIVEGKPCQYVCRFIHQMHKHCLEEHRWRSKDKGGYSKKRDNQNQVPW